MKKIVLISSIIIVLSSCEEKRICLYNDKEVPCGYQDLYNKFMAIENKLNESADGKIIPVEEKLALRKQWLKFYNSKKDSLAEALKLLDNGDFPIEQLSQIRVGELKQFEKSINDKENLASNLKLVEVSTLELDTAIIKDEKPRKYLLWLIKNNSTQNIKSISIDKQVIRNGNTSSPKINSTHFFTKDQISPIPEIDGLATVPPGSVLTLPFELEDSIKIEAQITSISFE